MFEYASEVRAHGVGKQMIYIMGTCTPPPPATPALNCDQHNGHMRPPPAALAPKVQQSSF